MFIENAFTDFQYFFWWILVATLSVVLHEIFHALAAWYEGDTTARDGGHLTLNPLVHMGWPSLLLLMFTGMCWGLCPVNPRRFRHRYGDALVSFAGPFANLLLMVGFGLFYVLFYNDTSLPPHVVENLVKFCRLGATANAAFFLFNLLPIPPLDGHSIVKNFFPETRRFYDTLPPMAFYGVLMVLFYLPLGLSGLFWDTSTQLASMTVQTIGQMTYWLT